MNSEEPPKVVGLVVAPKEKAGPFVLGVVGVADGRPGLATAGEAGWLPPKEKGLVVLVAETGALKLKPPAEGCVWPNNPGLLGAELALAGAPNGLLVVTGAAPKPLPNPVFVVFVGWLKLKPDEDGRASVAEVGDCPNANPPALEDGRDPSLLAAGCPKVKAAGAGLGDRPPKFGFDSVTVVFTFGANGLVLEDVALNENPAGAALLELLLPNIELGLVLKLKPEGLGVSALLFTCMSLVGLSSILNS